MIWRIAVVLIIIGLIGCNADKPKERLIDYAAQQDSSLAIDCKYAPFRPRNFPSKIIEISVTQRTNDPNNSFVGNAFAKCMDGDVRTHFVCGVVARRNNVGYVDNARRFFGIYRFESASFDLTAIGDKADKLCHDNGLF
jgi:hypothetical protein